jgi:hypothetical protein
MLRFSELRVGDTLPPITKGPITRQHLVEWCAAENDYYPLHYDERIASAMQIAGTPIQGTYKLALIGQLISKWLDGAGALCSLSINYRGLDLEGAVLMVGGAIVALAPPDNGRGRATIEVWVDGADMKRSSSGQATVELPS